MRKLVISLAAAATVLTAVPAFAQQLRVDPGGVDVRIGRDHDRDRERERHGYFRRHPGWYGRGDCRDVTVQRRLPDGSVITRQSRRCD